ICLFSSIVFYAQNETKKNTPVFKYAGKLLDDKTNEPLAFAHVAVLGTQNGAVTNENGKFTITSHELKLVDTLSFYFVGYKTKKISIEEFAKNATIYLTSETFSLNEFFVFADNKNAEDIVKMVLPNTGRNYKKSYEKNQVFTRNRYVSDINSIDIKFKKSSFEQLSEKMTKMVEKKLPRHSISYTDFLGNAYLSTNSKDTLKLDPIKEVRLKDKDLADINQLEDMFEKMFKNTKENEYWKIKSGIIGGKVDVEDETEEAKDSLIEHRNEKMKSYYYAKRLNGLFENRFQNKKKWEFLHNTNRYNYELVFGTQINGEKVYVIDFTPKNKGEYEGRLYIAMDTYALIKANYNYADGKTGTNIKMFGVGYTENVSEVNIYFEKIDETYHLKYYSQKAGTKVSFDRNLSLLKKKKRFLVDKKLNEIKVRLDMKVTEVNSFEILVISSEKIAPKVFNNFKQKPNFKTVYVDQFSDDLWKNYTIIEPSKQMRDYKKIE
ncbi:MAG: carboxypeptidase-like regulatory domain-containing protein, partial [Vicingaceae bacterium]|nr:carboxypeptidase-like regulatory domain-containing protein [Vicingaceae bacterium]